MGILPTPSERAIIFYYLCKKITMEKKFTQRNTAAGTSMNTYQAETSPGPIKKFVKEQVRKHKVIQRGDGKYSMPLRYAIHQAKKDIVKKVKNVVGDIKQKQSQKASGSTLRNASQKTSQNSSATCGPKGCGKIGN